MRLVRFEDISGEFAVELHPLLTVISGLDPRVRESLIRTVSAIPRGEDPQARGSIEVHGIYLDLNRETLDLLELHQDVNVVVRAEDLPGADDPLAGLRVHDSSAPASTDATDSDASELAVVDTEALGLEAAELESILHETTMSIEQLRAQLLAMAEERHGVNQQVDSARASLDSFAVAALSVARDELADVEHRVSLIDVDPAADERARLEHRLQELISEADGLRREAKRLGGIDTETVRAAFSDLDAALAIPETEPSPEAQELVAEWRDLIGRLEELDDQGAAAREALATLTEHRDECRQRVADAELALRAPALDADLVEQLEDTHDEVFDLDGKASRFGGAKIRRRQEELRHREDDLLARLGFDTWSSYVMGLSNTDALAGRQAELESRRAELAEADAALAAATETPDPDGSGRDELEAKRQELLDRVTLLVGHYIDGDPVETLESMRVESGSDEPRPDPDAAAIALCTALESTGTQIDPNELDIETVHSLAAGWLEEMAALPDQIAAVDEQHQAAETEIDSLAARLEELGAAPDPSAGAVELDEAHNRVRSAEERVGLHDVAAARLAELSKSQEQLNASERDLQFSIGERERQLAEQGESLQQARDRLRTADDVRKRREAPRSMTPLLMETAPLASMEARAGTRRAAGVDALEWYVLARLAQQRAISFAGSVPILIDDAFVAWSFDELDEVFARLERMSEVIQIIYLTDDPDVANWGRNLGRTRAQVLDLRSIVA